LLYELSYLAHNVEVWHIVVYLHAYVTIN
jgi:hypothetical protein